MPMFTKARYQSCYRSFLEELHGLVFSELVGIFVFVLISNLMEEDMRVEIPIYIRLHTQCCAFKLMSQ
jgi:hypothetical protein